MNLDPLGPPDCFHSVIARYFRGVAYYPDSYCLALCKAIVFGFTVPAGQIIWGKGAKSEFSISFVGHATAFS